MRTIPLISFIIVLFLYSCSLFESEKDSKVQDFIFEIQYVNYAWGFNHFGAYIDKNGNFYSFTFDSSAQFISNEKEIYSIQELKNKFSFNNELMDEIGLNIITEKRKLITKAIDGAYSDTLNTGADMGQTTYSCFIFENEIYLKKVLRCEGDWSYNLETPEADSIVNWLKYIYTE